MSKMLVHHKVKDFNAWKAVYDSNADVRAANGELSDKIYRDESDPNSLTILFGWDSFENARKFVQSPELKATMEKAGVLGPPDVHFLTEV
jgi:quinol monooxygenase YgiN